jgi:hypothetical protein
MRGPAQAHEGGGDAAALALQEAVAECNHVFSDSVFSLCLAGAGLKAGVVRRLTRAWTTDPGEV